jgi:gliding motility-associated-like protein
LLNAGNTGSSVLWSDGSGAPTLLVSQTGTYWLRASLPGCIGTDTIRVTKKFRPVVNLGADTIICSGDAVVINPGVQDGSLLWQDGTDTPLYLAQQPGVYALVVTNDCGTARDEKRITEGICVMYFPSGFSPNKDGKNDIFSGISQGRLAFYRLRVFNRWGQQIFESTNILKGWDGNFNGLPQPTGTYVWYAEYETARSGGRKTQQGTVMLIR